MRPSFYYTAEALLEMLEGRLRVSLQTLQNNAEIARIRAERAEDRTAEAFSRAVTAIWLGRYDEARAALIEAKTLADA